MNSTNAQRLELELPFETTQWLVGDQHLHYNGVSVQHTVPQGLKPLFAVVKALLPTAACMSQAQEQLIINPNIHDSDSAFPKLLPPLIFAMANNFAGLNRVPVEEILEFLIRQANMQLLQNVLSNGGPESEAFVEKLFVAAIEFEDARLVEFLLRRGLNVNDLVCSFHGRYYTPVERSSMLSNIDITRLLLGAKADVNKTVLTGNVYGAVHSAVFGSKNKSVPLELVRMLLDAGGEFREDVLRRVTDCCDHDLLDVFLDYWAKTKLFDIVHPRISEMVTEKFENEIATRMVTRILQTGVGTSHGASATVSEHLGPTLDIAAERGNLGLVQFLFPSYVTLTPATLVLAIKSRNKDLVRFLLNAGAEVDVLTKTRLNKAHTTPLAEAIRWGDVEIMSLLEVRGAWSWIGKKKFTQTCTATLQAASEAG